VLSQGGLHDVAINLVNIQVYSDNEQLYREMLCRARLWNCMLSVFPWRWGMFFTLFGILRK